MPYFPKEFSKLFLYNGLNSFIYELYLPIWIFSSIKPPTISVWTSFFTDSSISLLALSYEYSFERENTIENSCSFDILRIRKKDIMCSDYGKYVKYKEKHGGHKKHEQ